jgi:probable phosphoglycerate mutase
VTWSTDPPPGLRTTGDEATGTRLVLVRHGEGACNVRGVIGGPRGCEGLTERGRDQARALARRLERSGELLDATALYTSTLPRAIETAALLAPGLPDLVAVADCDLCELHPGEADGLTWGEFLARFGAPAWEEDPDRPLAPGGESWLGFYRRVSAALARLVELHRGQRVVVVVHGGVIETAMKSVLDAAATDRLRLLTQHASMTEIEYDGAGARLLSYNDRAPLASA